MSTNHSPSHPRHSKGKAVLAPISLVFILLMSCSFSSPLSLFMSTATNTPTRTYTPSSTSTSTATHTSTSTATQTSTPLPPRFDVQTRTDNSTLVLDLKCGYQFVLAKSWTMLPFLLDATDIKRFSIVVADNTTVYPNLKMSIGSFEREMASLDLELYHYSAEYFGGLERRVLSQTLTRNVYGTELGTLKISNMYNGYGYTTDDNNFADSLSSGSPKSKNRIQPLVGPSYYESYQVLFYCDDEVINFNFTGKIGSYKFSSTDLQLIYTIQNSIQFK